MIQTDTKFSTFIDSSSENNNEMLNIRARIAYYKKSYKIDLEYIRHKSFHVASARNFLT